VRPPTLQTAVQAVDFPLPDSYLKSTLLPYSFKSANWNLVFVLAKHFSLGFSMSRLTPLSRRLLWPYATVAIVTVAALLAFLGISIRAADVERMEASLLSRVRLITPHIPTDPAQFSQTYLDSLVLAFSEQGRMRVTLIRPNGFVVAESDTLETVMKSLSGRTEVIAALSGITGVARRYSTTLGQKMLYVAIPQVRDGVVVGIVRGAEPLTRIAEAFWSRVAWLLGISALLSGLGALIINYFVRRVTRPLEELRQGAVEFADGKLSSHLPEYDTEELESLGRALNHMAAQLDERIHTVIRQREEQTAVLSAMLEGVLAVDSESRIITMNRAASKLFQADREKAKGRTIEEVVRIPDIQNFVHETLQAGHRTDREIVRYDPDERILQLRGSPIQEDDVAVGAVVVINDVTQVRRLEKTRRDFVANASHELKTPVTAIKGAVETLRDGAVDEPESAKRFLSVIARQSDYLSSIIDDLLSLARIEQATENKKLAVEDQEIRAILEDVMEAACAGSPSRSRDMELNCSLNLHAPVNAFLLRQAVLNLVDNACKYTPESTKIDVRAEIREEKLVIEVEDHGPGIPEKHIPRIFERFYRVEPSRNKKFGGTGLGLAIVKHAAMAHGGTAEVQSHLGEGSTFTINLPVSREA
jgi:two-component system phosphate regulon sensor histidine kinase PhoR